MKKYLYAFALLGAACNTHPAEVDPADSTIVINPKPYPEERSEVKTSPVAHYSESMGDSLNDWKLDVSLYETKRSFHYTVRVQAKEIRVSDTLNLPNFGIEPKPEIRKGKDALTCIIGFLDQKGQFQEYREVSFRNDRLRMRTLHTYTVGHYRTKVN